MNLTIDRINYLNIGLILLSFGLAIYLPFELFLFSYAVLGPLHYLTEIAWLHKQDYFLPKKWGYIILIILGLLTGYGMLTGADWGKVMLPIAFFTALGLFLFKENKGRILTMIIGGAIYLFMHSSEMGSNVWMFYFIFFIVLLPTLVHVFFFTGLFMIYGNLKSKSLSGHISLGVFILCAVGIFFFTPEFQYSLSVEVRDTYHVFTLLNQAFIQVLGLEGSQIGVPVSNDMIYESQGGIIAMRFIAFAYTYHYLNWFSKTSIIQWHKIAVPKLMAILVLWVVSVLFYCSDYRLGFNVLFILSMLHVYLEFPLNFKTISAIGKSFTGNAKK